MFTHSNDPSVEASLSRQMDLIVKETARVYGHGCTIVLAGGFGRGEGSFRFSEMNRPVPIHDFDLFVITDRKVDPNTHSLLESRILEGLSEITGSDLVALGFVLGLQVIPLSSLDRLPPDLSTFELKEASTVLHGPDLRHLIPVTKDKIALGSAAITLFHRTTALLKNVEPEYLRTQNYSLDRRLETVYECCKVYTEICTALSLLGGFYEPSYKLRAENFESNFHLFGELRNKLPELGQKIRIYTDMKLRSDFSSIIDKPVDNWLEARRTLDMSLRYFLSKFLRLEFQGSWIEFCQEAEKRLRWLFFYDYLAFYFSRRLVVRSSYFVHLANLAFQCYDGLGFRRKAQREGKRPARIPLTLTSPILRVYLASALTLLSLLDDGTVSQRTLEAAQFYLHRIFDMPRMISPDIASWKRVRDGCVVGQRLYFGNMMKKVF